jgi:hypothetical protein
MPSLTSLSNPITGTRLQDHDLHDRQTFQAAFPYFAGAYWLQLKAEQQVGAWDPRTVATAALFFVNMPALETSLREVPPTPTPTPAPALVSQVAAPASLPVMDSDLAELTTSSAQEPELPEAESEALAFEPYHTVDYFASQGIKLTANIAAQDGLGKQLKSFTDWLKTMRKLPEAERIAELDDAGNQKIIDMAENSVLVREVITASMAEVLAHQGKIEAAISIYEKLSLHNPAKSPYFAAKIDALKQRL